MSDQERTVTKFALEDGSRIMINHCDVLSQQELQIMPSVSVIIPVYNIESYIEECIESVLAQTWQDYELILVDDGSTDGSGTILDRYGERDKRITVIHKENGGLSSARNAGLDAAIGKYIYFLDGDDWRFTEKPSGNSRS